MINITKQLGLEATMHSRVGQSENEKTRGRFSSRLEITNRMRCMG